MVSTGLQHAAVIAIAWDRFGTMGCIAMLFQEASPSFKTIRFDVFEKACLAIKDADLLTAVQAPLSLSAVNLVLEGEAAGQPAAADAYVALALNNRISLLLTGEDKVDGQLDPSDLAEGRQGGLVVDHQYDVFKRLRAFFAGKHQKPPYWFTVLATRRRCREKNKADQEKAAVA